MLGVGLKPDVGLECVELVSHLIGQLGLLELFSQ